MRAQSTRWAARTRRVLVALVACAVASHAHAQQAPAPRGNGVRAMAGALMVVAGAAIIPVMARPGGNVTVTVPGLDGVRAGARVEAGTSWPGVAVGAGLAAGGAWLVWSGLTAHPAPAAAPSTAVGVRLDHGGLAIGVRRRW